MADTSYHRIVRKLVVGFGNLFKDITLVRYNPDLTESERFIVPIAYADKEMYVQRLQSDPNLDKKVQMTLPRMSFEMSGLSYDPSRKQNTNTKAFANDNGTILSQYNPVPYNFDFNLYLYVRNIEDGTQIIEHILPYFTPDYTIKLNLIPEMGIVKEIPIVLNTTTSEIDYEGIGRTAETRMIIWTLNFTVKGFIYGKTSPTNLIQSSITNILRNITADALVEFNMATGGTGTYQPGEVVYQGYSFGNSTASAKVVSWSNNILTLTNIQGNFVSNLPIIGIINNGNYTFNSYNVVSTIIEKVTVTPSPNNATANSNYTYNINIES
jgi:hypothetical protein